MNNWFLDPRNITGLANDDNDGASATTPLLSWNKGVVPNLGKDPILTTPTTFQFLSGSPPGGTDPIEFSPTLSQGASLIFQGDLGPAQKVTSGILSNVVAKDYVAGNLLAANLGPLVTPNMVVVNTTAGKASLAWVRANIGGNNFSLSQAMSRQQAPYMSVAPAYVDTWANGDTFDVYLPDSIHLVSLTPKWGDSFGKAYIQRLGLGANFGAADPAVIMSPGVFMFESRCDRALGWDSSGFTRSTIVSNCAFTDITVGIAGGTFNTGNVVLFIETPFARFWGGFGAVDLTGGLLDGNFIATALRGVASSVRGCTLGNVYLEAILLSEGRTSMNQYDFDPTRLWGPGTLEIDDGRVSIYGTTAAAALLQLGGVGLGTSTQKTGYTVSPVGVWTGGVATTPTNIDLNSSPNGIGILIPDGGSIGVGAGL